ncbi:hypothetical protein F4679DRAFT_589190 [Xylaria curta]|nr:hypothetical protein F4679DRAFT_589190 [Xylaria curta]
MAYLNQTAQVTLLVGALVSALILFLGCLCLYLYTRDRQNRDEDLEKCMPEGEQERWETVSADASTLSFLWDPPPLTRNVRRWCGFVVCEAPVVREACAMRIEEG